MSPNLQTRIDRVKAAWGEHETDHPLKVMAARSLPNPPSKAGEVDRARPSPVHDHCPQCAELHGGMDRGAHSLPHQKVRGAEARRSIRARTFVAYVAFCVAVAAYTYWLFGSWLEW